MRRDIYDNLRNSKIRGSFSCLFVCLFLNGRYLRIFTEEEVIINRGSGKFLGSLVLCCSSNPKRIVYFSLMQTLLWIANSTETHSSRLLQALNFMLMIREERDKGVVQSDHSEVTPFTSPHVQLTRNNHVVTLN